MKQNATEIKIQKELDNIAGILQNKTYDDYCKYEDEVGDLIEKHCPFCQNEIDNTTIGIFMLLANIRNYIREKANIQFKEN